MPEAVETQSLPPLVAALRRFWRGGGARFGVAVVATMFLLACYAPFIASEVALVWRDADGLRFPIFADLFNQRSYGKPHELLFNLAALLLPPIAVGWWLLRRRWSAGRRTLAAGALIVAAWLLAMVPVAPRGDGWQALWDTRPSAPETYAQWQALPPDERPTALFPPIPHRQDRPYVGAGLLPPLSINPATGARLWLGSEASGRDVLAFLIFGARISLTIGLVATGISMLIGVLIGGVSGYFGGRVDLVLQRLVEIMLCFPTLILVLVIVAMTRRDIFIIMLVLGFTGWAGTARLVRGEFLAQSVREYVLAAEAMGLPRTRIMFRHILPNAMTPLFIAATFSIAGAVLTESGLAFLGLGDPLQPSWGMLLNQGRESIRYPWIIYAPGVAVFLLVSALNLIGSGLSRAFNPRAGR